jgi:hypothetical protein
MIAKLLITLAVPAALASILLETASAEEARTVRVQFKAGADSAEITDRIKGGESVLYKLNARDGQFLSVSLSPDNQSADYNIYIPGRGPGGEALFTSAAGGREYVGQLYKTGDHTVSVFLNRNAARKGETANYDIVFKLTASPPAASAPAKPAAPRADAAVFMKEVSYGAMRFKVTSPATDADNRFTITPSGLKASNDPITVSVKGFVVDVQCDDMDGDDSPEVAVIIQEGKQERGRAYVFSTNAKRSLSEVHFPDVTDDAKLLSGYGGGDQYAFVENTFIRRFPLYSDGEKTGKTRQFQFKLKPGEAMKQLVLDRHTEY